MLASVPNFGHWYPRARTVLGLFDYDRRGILDEGHTRFFTRRSFAKLARSAGFNVARAEAVGLPLAHLAGSANSNGRVGVAGHLDRTAVRLRPTLFAYQFIFELRPASFAAPDVR